MLKHVEMPEPVVFWRWINPEIVGAVTTNSVYHISIPAPGAVPEKIFDRYLLDLTDLIRIFKIELAHSKLLRLCPTLWTMIIHGPSSLEFHHQMEELQSMEISSYSLLMSNSINLLKVN